MNFDFNYIVVGNILGFIGTMFMVISGAIKDNKKFFIVQDFEMGFLTLSNLVLGGYTGAIVSFMGIIRNTLCMKDKMNLRNKIIIVIIQTVACLITNNLGIIGLCPLFAVVFYSFLITKDAKKLKILNASTLVLWAIYDFYIKSYTSFTMDVLTIITSLVGLYRVNQNNKNFKNTNE